MITLTSRREISADEEEDDSEKKEAFCSIKPDEVPEVPTSRFLSRVSDNKFVLILNGKVYILTLIYLQFSFLSHFRKQLNFELEHTDFLFKKNIVLN